MKAKLLPVSSVFLALALAACASIIHGTTQDIGISSSPTGAFVTVDNGPKSATPFVAQLSRKNTHLVHIVADGYAPADLTLTKTVSGWVWGNLVFGGLIGLAVDAVSGGLYNLTPAQLSATLTKQSASIAPTKDGIYIILVQNAETEWQRVGQLQRNH